MHTTNDALSILLATFAPFWLASLLAHLLWANLRALVAATRFAARAYPAVAGAPLVLLAALATTTTPGEPSSYATLPARAPLFFWGAWYALALRGYAASRLCLALAWALLAWALAQPDAVRLLAVGVANLVGERIALSEEYGDEGDGFGMLGFGRSKKWSFSPVEWAQY